MRSRKRRRSSWGVSAHNNASTKELFHDEAVMLGYLDGRLGHRALQNLYDNIDIVGVDPGCRARINVIDVEKTVAIVCVLEDNRGAASTSATT